MRIPVLAMFGAIAAPMLFAATAYQNQIGFLTNGVKQMTVLEADGKDVVFKDANGETVLTVKAPEAKLWEPAEEKASLVDFSEIKTPGVYQAYIGDEKIGHPINIADNAYEEVTKGALKFYYFQRCSFALDKEYAGEYARAAGHPDTAIRYHSSTGKAALDADGNMLTFNGAKGWYDAGDYGKYIVNSGISTYTLLQLYQHNKAYFDTLTWNIPESKNDVPDILDEIRWNLEWMLTMQDEDGGIFHKLTTKSFAGMVLPEKATSARFAIGKSVTATWDFVGVLALASEIYKPFDAEFAEKCVKAATRAHDWALMNPYAFYEQPSDVGTGTYSDGNAVDEQIWGAAELYRVTKNEAILKSFQQYRINKNRQRLPGWATVYGLAAFTVATNPDVFPAEDVDSSKALIMNLADDYLKEMDNGYGLAVSSNDLFWGSNAVVGNKAMLLLHAYYLTKKDEYLNAAVSIVDYVFGRNPLDLSYMTGYGINTPHNPHHRPSQGDDIDEPVPGMIVGGANKSADDADIKKYIKENSITATAKKYCDKTGSYSTNEVAINWNAPIAYALGSIQAIAATGKVYDISTKPLAEYEVTAIPSAAKLNAMPTAGFRKVVRNNKVQIERTTKTGEKLFFNLKGKRIK